MPLPPRAYIPGHGVHPHRVAGARAPAAADLQSPPLDPSAWGECTLYLRGFMLFNRGYYWEAHECWEQVWIANLRTGAAGEMLRGLIQLAAAGLKVRQGLGHRAAGLAARAASHFSEGLRMSATPNFAGFTWTELIAFADEVSIAGPKLRGSAEPATEVVFERALTPRD